jgi:hypothetical protein
MTVDVSSAVDSANAATAATARPKETGAEGLKYVNLRFKASEYVRLKKAYGG